MSFTRRLSAVAQRLAVWGARYPAVSWLQHALIGGAVAFVVLHTPPLIRGPVAAVSVYLFREWEQTNFGFRWTLDNLMDVVSPLVAGMLVAWWW